MNDQRPRRRRAAGPTSPPTVEEPLPPTPWTGDLVVRVECRTAPDLRSGRRHDVAIHDDWSVTTPHDLEAERVAAAFGGYCSCLELIDRVLPRLPEPIRRVARRAPSGISKDAKGRWRTSEWDAEIGCSTPDRRFRSAEEAFAHSVDPTHVAECFGVPAWQVAPVLRRVARECTPVFDAALPAARLVREADGVERLWRSGIHPDDIPAMAEWAASVRDPLPVAYFESVAFGHGSPGWIDDVLRHRPDADTAAWLVLQRPPRSADEAREWGGWLGLGLSRREFLVVVAEHLPLHLVPEVAAETGWTERASGRALVAWAEAGCVPSPAHLATIVRRRADHWVPGRAAVDAAVTDANAIGVPLERSECGVMLALAGSRPELLAAVRRGVRDAAALAEHLDGRRTA